MKVSVVAPALDSLYGAARIFLPPAGATQIAAPVVQAGHDVEIIDITYEPSLPDFRHSDVVMFSVMTSQYNNYVELAKIAHAAGKTVIAGGVHPTFLSEESLATGYVDYVVRGEGEETITELLGAMREHPATFRPNGMLGISYRAPDGTIHHNPDRPPPQDLDAIPWPARHLLGKYMHIYKRTKLDKVKSAGTLTMSRGCPYNCSFCSVTKFSGARWRTRSVTSVIEEIEHLFDRYGYEAIIFTDDLMTTHRKQIIELCDTIIERRLNFPWWCMARADNVMMWEDMVEKMAEAGCITVFLGLESGNEETLKNVNKGVATKLVQSAGSATNVGEAAVNRLRQYGMNCVGAFLIGEPHETRKQVEQTIGFAKRVDPEWAQFTIYTPLPGTDSYAAMKDIVKTKDWRLYDCTHGVFDSPYLTGQEMEKLLRKAYRGFYMRFGRIIRGQGLRFDIMLSVLRNLFRHRHPAKAQDRPTNGLLSRLWKRRPVDAASAPAYRF
ncbi:MAG: cobalamin B12-binding domain-containing protein [Candidatus Latescibacteria bacterium]|nr:cobalamin B12-binding domain-containing protein [Candidatus Latescibacterota bacterium]